MAEIDVPPDTTPRCDRLSLATLLDRGQVRLFQVVVYSAYILAGLQAVAVGGPPNAVAQAMGATAAHLWIALVITCPALALTGIALERRPIWIYAQVAGSAGIACATAAYVVAVIEATWARSASFAAWIAASLTICAVLMAWRDARRIRVVSRWVRQERTGDRP